MPLVRRDLANQPDRNRTVKLVRPRRELLKINPIRYDNRSPGLQRLQLFENLSSRSDPTIDALIQKIPSHAIKEVAYEDNLQRRNAASRCGNDRVIARNVGMHDIE